ncbi:hypothetical protein [Oceanicola sp. 502str15]|uniref:hypothetical protein n=1 Tax=Oceanicola sp. 502str15 TaxID=2696061 RepID=UPI002094D6DF|nr:hypothetical protein [Oceanicola sp. 502str15]MCO6384601.1 hypothetical protein [Oceanicola sp. 502str15]
MTRIQAAESGFAKANAFFVMAWVVTAIILITALVDYRALRREAARTDERVAVYSQLEDIAAAVSTDLRTAIYLMPGYAGEAKGIETIRQARSEALARVEWIAANYGALMPDLAAEDRQAIQPVLTYMKSMFLLNDALEGVSVFIEGEPSLLLAEHEAGTYLTAASVEGLRMEDAVRYLWLASLDLQSWTAVLKRHQEALEAGRPREDMAAEFAGAVEVAQSDAGRARRVAAEKAWTAWVKSGQGAVDGAQGDVNSAVARAEKRRRAALTLAQTGVFLDQALVRKAELDLLQGGETTSVKIPVISTALQLRDAIMFAPWILAFCSISIMIYTRRGMHYAPEEKGELVVGNIPSFYAVYGVNKGCGIAVAMLLLALPAALLPACLWFLQPVLAQNYDAASVIFYSGVAVSLLTALLTFAQIPSVLRGIDLEVLMRLAPE